MNVMKSLGAGLLALNILLPIGCRSVDEAKNSKPAVETVVRQTVTEQVVRECSKPKEPTAEQKRLDDICGRIYGDRDLEARRDSALADFKAEYAEKKRMELQQVGYGDAKVRKYSVYVCTEDKRNGCYVITRCEGNVLNAEGDRIYREQKDIRLYFDGKDKMKLVHEEPAEMLPLPKEVKYMRRPAASSKAVPADSGSGCDAVLKCLESQKGGV